MPAPKAPTSNKRLIWGAVALVAIVAAWSYGGQGDAPTPKTAQTKAATKAAAGASDQYTSADRTVKFEPLKEKVKDAFQPLVFKPTTAINPDTGGIPDWLTGGEPWNYTGKADTDGKTVAVLEDSAAGETDFVSVGEHWKKAKVKSISDYQIVLVGDDGRTAAIKMGEVAAAPATKGSITPLPPATVQPLAMQGNIGNMTISPTVDVTAQPAYGQPGGRGGRGRRNRGGGGGYNNAVGTDNGN